MRRHSARGAANTRRQSPRSPQLPPQQRPLLLTPLSHVCCHRSPLATKQVRRGVVPSSPPEGILLSREE
ncbi:hypothetical protein E2C01_055754 [Portunus trituberculatus]|uniref:Uncharacterized protein n=1 Tax=Portunus trituberculatus TaxID=210409 RepID=A0A5B7GVW2_PORTR|nr:hypothetical protein [Portunus trituberculatus]